MFRKDEKIGVFFTVLANKKKKSQHRKLPAGGRRGERKGKEGFLKDKEGLDNSGDRDGIRGALVSRRCVKRTVSLE
jgi:hypothetical protein